MLLTNSNAFCFRLESLAILEKCVRRLASDGGIFEMGSTLWSDALDDGCSSSEVIEASPEKTRIRVDEIQILKSLSKGLDLLKNSLDKFIEARCEEILPSTRHHGLASLPDDILQAIFEQLLESYGNPFLGSRKIIHGLSLVSQRFRENILAFAKAWTYLDVNACSTESFPLFLERSKNRPLNVGFVFSESVKEKIVSALSFGDRWKYLWADFEGTEDTNSLPSLSLHAIKRLDIWGRPRSHGSVPWTSPGWSFPNVEQIHIHGDLPNPESFPYEPLKSLTYTTACLRSYSEPPFDDVFLTRFTEFLRPAISLRALYLDLRPNIVVWFGIVHHEVELPNVKTFSISNEVSEVVPYYRRDEDGFLTVTHDYFSSIVRMIKLPNVEDIHVTYNFMRVNDFGDEDDLEEELLEIFSPHFGSVTSLSFKILRWSDTLHVGKFFEHFPNLRRLALDSKKFDCHLKFSEYLSRANLVNLDSFRIKLYDKMTQLHDTPRSMTGASASPREVVIHSGHTLDVEEPRVENISPVVRIEMIFD